MLARLSWQTTLGTARCLPGAVGSAAERGADETGFHRETCGNTSSCCSPVSAMWRCVPEAAGAWSQSARPCGGCPGGPREEMCRSLAVLLSR